MDRLLRGFFHIMRGVLWLARPFLNVLWVRRATPGVGWERIAVLLDSGVGDALMATPMLRELRRQLPAVTILAVVNRGTAQVMARNPDVDRLCIFRNSGGSAKLIGSALRALRKFRPQAILVPQTGNIIVQILAAYYSGAPIRVKHQFRYPRERRYSDFEFLFTHHPVVSTDRHRVWDNLNLLAALGLRTETTAPALVFSVSESDRARAQMLLQAKGWKNDRHTVGMHPGVGTATLNKQWPAERFAELGRKLSQEQKCQIVLVGGPVEVPLCQSVANAIGPACYVVAGECSLAETAAVIERCDFFVSNDSGLMHLAAAVNARGLALYGKTDPVKIGPLGGAIQVAQASRMEELTVAEVFHTCSGLVTRAASQEQS